jgi:hypothetical protein
MRFIISVLFFQAIYICLPSQILYDFESGNLDSWQQSTPDHWEISSIHPLNGNASLHHAYDNPVSDVDQISFAYSNEFDFKENVTWSFRIKHAYNPSSSNYWVVFLACDTPASYSFTSACCSGIAVGVNFTGSDDILKIWKVEKGKISIALSSTVNWEKEIADSAALLNITRTPDSIFAISIAADGNTEHLKVIGKGHIDYIPESRYFGIYYKYSSLQDRKLWLDDITVHAKFITDTIPPAIDTAYLVNKRRIRIIFSESIYSPSLNKNNFLLIRQSLHPDSVIMPDKKTIDVFFNDDLVSGDTAWIEVKDIKDAKGNLMLPATIALFYFQPKTYDVLINEIMADPEPAVGLPQYEYIELFNQSEFQVNIENWNLYVGKSLEKLATSIIAPYGFLILCNNSAKPFFETYGPALAAWTDEYLLANSGNMIVLKDSDGNIISFVRYSSSWYNDSYKESGGWSLELIDPANPCGGENSWRPSTDKTGGTPGKQNSVVADNRDYAAPGFLYALVPTDSTIILKFSEPLDSATIKDTSGYYINNGIGYPEQTQCTGSNFNAVLLHLNHKIRRDIEYELTVKSKICDCAGNQLSNDIKIKIALPVSPDSFDVVINELLFNPFPYGSEFIELYNRSEKVIDAGSIIAATIDTNENKVKDFAYLADKGYLMFPGDYIVLTECITDLEKFCSISNRTNILNGTNFPNLDDRKGIVALMDKSYRVIDEFKYSDDMQYSQLSNSEGVSLERLNPDWQTQSGSNWHSAAQTAGYATPGYKNSQYTTTQVQDQVVSIIPEIFTPDNDGLDDVISVKIMPDYTGTCAVINIFGSSGILLRHLVKKQYLGTENIFTWDGTSDEGRLQASGIYIVHIMLISEKGDTREYKKICVIGKK